MSSVILLLMVPDPALSLAQAPPGPPKQPPDVANVVWMRPRSTWRYSAFRLQLPKNACSMPAPRAQPTWIDELFQLASGQVPKAGSVALHAGTPGRPAFA